MKGEPDLPLCFRVFFEQLAEKNWTTILNSDDLCKNFHNFLSEKCYTASVVNVNTSKCALTKNKTIAPIFHSCKKPESDSCVV